MKIIHMWGISLIVLGFIFFVQPVCADSKYGAAQFLTEIGIQHYERGQIDEAAHELSKALMLDPGNKKAKEYLAQIGITDQVYKGAKNKSTELVRLARSVKDYENQVAALMLEKKILENKLNQVMLERDTAGQIAVAHDLEKDLLQVKLDETAKIFDKSEEAKMRQLAIIEDMYAQKINDLENSADYQSSLMLSQRMADRERLVREKEQYYRDIVIQFSRAVDRLTDYEKELKEIDNKYFEMNHKLTVTRAMDHDLLSYLEGNLDEQRKTIEDLKDKLVIDAIELGQKHAVLDSEIRKNQMD